MKKRQLSLVFLSTALSLAAIPSASGAVTSGLAYSAFNIAGNPDTSGRMFTFLPSAGPAVPDTNGSNGNTAWANVSSTVGAYNSDGGDDNVGFGAEVVWNRVGGSGVQDGAAFNVELVYRGFFYDSDGIFAFAENIDDNVLVKINGTPVISNRQDQQGGAWQTPTSSLSGSGANAAAGENQAFGGLTPAQQAGSFGAAGWYHFELRLGEFGGTGGPHNSANGGVGWNANFGFGIAGIGNSALPGSIFDAGQYLPFSAASFPNAPDGGPGLRYDDIDVTGGTNIVIPEPASMGLLGLGLVALVRRRRA